MNEPVARSPEPLAQRLRRLRLALGVSQDKLSKLLGVSAAQVYLVESGRRSRLNLDTAQRYAEVFSVSLPYIMYGMELKDTSEPMPLADHIRTTTSLSEQDIADVVRHVQALEARQHLEHLHEEPPQSP